MPIIATLEHLTMCSTQPVDMPSFSHNHYYRSHFLDEETGRERQVTCPKGENREVADAGVELRPAAPQPGQ